MHKSWQPCWCKLAADPPTRRRTLDGEPFGSLRDLTRTWRVEGVFDSSYSSIVNRHLAMALQDTGAPMALYTYEQGEQPFPSSRPWKTQRLGTWQQGRQPLHPP